MFLQGDYEENIHRTAIVYIEKQMPCKWKNIVKK